MREKECIIVKDKNKRKTFIRMKALQVFLKVKKILSNLKLDQYKQILITTKISKN